MVLEVDPVKRRISLGLKQTLANPWEAFAEKHPVGIDRRGRGQEQDRVRPVHRPRRRRRRHGPPLRPRLEPAGRAGRSRTTSRATWSRRRCSTSTSRRSASRSASSSSPAIPSPKPRGELRKGAVVTCEVIEVKDGGIEVKIVDTDLDRLHPPLRPRRATAPSSARSASPSARRSTPGSPTSTRRPARSPVSIKALEIAEEKEAVAQYGSSDSGASLGDILGAALKRATEKKD